MAVEKSGGETKPANILLSSLIENGDIEDQRDRILNDIDTFLIFFENDIT